MTSKTLDPYRGRDPRDIPAYTTFEAARYLRVPERTLFDWSFGRSYKLSSGAARHMAPLIPVADKQRHVLSFTNLAELHVLDALRRTHNVEMKKIRKTILYVGEIFNTDHPLVDQEMLTDGLNVFVEYYGDLINASQAGQLAMRQVMDAHLQRIERDPSGGIVRLFPLTRKRAAVEQLAHEPRIIAIDPLVASGRPVIQGSRVPTVEVAERFKAGEPLSDLANDFRRTIAEIEEAVRIELDLDAA